mmetsp:Transcript_56265/g.134097  ORF Transcript_56265/g.134097 Transcript_56265/m.134097 type:complete len:89 (+) Transcript_56265:1150-1416(+)
MYLQSIDSLCTFVRPAGWAGHRQTALCTLRLQIHGSRATLPIVQSHVRFHSSALTPSASAVDDERSDGLVQLLLSAKSQTLFPFYDSA